MANIEARMIRAKLIEALSTPGDWRVESRDLIRRKSDGLWVGRDAKQNHFLVGSEDHGLAQATLDDDDELITAFHVVIDIDIGSGRGRRPIMEMLGVPQYER